MEDIIVHDPSLVLPIYGAESAAVAECGSCRGTSVTFGRTVLDWTLPVYSVLGTGFACGLALLAIIAACGLFMATCVTIVLIISRVANEVVKVTSGQRFMCT